MSQENVELVRRVYEAHDRGDFTAVFAAYDPEIEWHVLRVAEFGFDPVYVGHDGVRTFWRTWLSAWETTSFEYDEFVDAARAFGTMSCRLCTRRNALAQGVVVRRAVHGCSGRAV